MDPDEYAFDNEFEKEFNDDIEHAINMIQHEREEIDDVKDEILRIVLNERDSIDSQYRSHYPEEIDTIRKYIRYKLKVVRNLFAILWNILTGRGLQEPLGTKCLKRIIMAAEEVRLRRESAKQDNKSISSRISGESSSSDNENQLYSGSISSISEKIDNNPNLSRSALTENRIKYRDLRKARIKDFRMKLSDVVVTGRKPPKYKKTGIEGTNKRLALSNTYSPGKRFGAAVFVAVTGLVIIAWTVFILLAIFYDSPRKISSRELVDLSDKHKEVIKRYQNIYEPPGGLESKHPDKILAENYYIHGLRG